MRKVCGSGGYVLLNHFLFFYFNQHIWHKYSVGYCQTHKEICNIKRKALQLFFLSETNEASSLSCRMKASVYLRCEPQNLKLWSTAFRAVTSQLRTTRPRFSSLGIKSGLSRSCFAPLISSMYINAQMQMVHKKLCWMWMLKFEYETDIQEERRRLSSWDKATFPNPAVFE